MLEERANRQTAHVWCGEILNFFTYDIKIRVLIFINNIYEAVRNNIKKIRVH